MRTRSRESEREDVQETNISHRHVWVKTCGTEENGLRKGMVERYDQMTSIPACRLNNLMLIRKVGSSNKSCKQTSTIQIRRTLLGHIVCMCRNIPMGASNHRQSSPPYSTSSVTCTSPSDCSNIPMGGQSSSTVQVILGLPLPLFPQIPTLQYGSRYFLVH